MDIGAYLAPLAVDLPRLQTLATEFSRTFRHLALHSTEQFLPTPINVLPRGTEEGTYLAIDVGGSNLRVGFIELLGAKVHDGGEIRRMHEKSWPIQDHFKMDRADELFSWIGSCIALVVAEFCQTCPGSVWPRIPLGITFSFPMIQTRISEAMLMNMGKGFAITSELNLGKMILEGYAKHMDGKLTRNGTKTAGMRLPEIEIVAITNDTVATLASLAYSAHALPSSRVAMGLIVGTGTNSSVTMRLKDLHEAKRSSIILPAKADPDEAEIVINTEWTIKGAAPPLQRTNLVTQWDEELDRCCEAPGFQPFEYMTAGRYLGELCRLILHDYFTQHQGAAPESLPRDLCHRNALSTFFLSDVVAKSASAEALVPQLRKHLPAPHPNIWDWTVNSADAFRQAAKALQLRSAGMIAAATVGLLVSAGDLQWKHDDLPQTQLKQPCEELIVAFAGGVITSYPGFMKTCHDTIDSLIDTLTRTEHVKKVVLRDANDGGLVGAGILAGTVWNLP